MRFLKIVTFIPNTLYVEKAIKYVFRREFKKIGVFLIKQLKVYNEVKNHT
jgi:hypothetical protein